MANGILVIDKPAGWTSMDVCAKLRGIFHEKRVGHAGTLDPMATGVLPVFLGRATRAVEYASESMKEYIFGIKLGTVTNTQDTTGEILEERPAGVSREELVAAAEQFTGEIMQVPPMYSAIKVKGKKLYELARKGKEVERQPRKIYIYAIGVMEQEPPEGTDYLLRVVCSKGTYVRTLCHDIGQALGCGACMSYLRRVQAGGFTAEDSVALEQVQAAADRGEAEQLLLPVDTLFRDREKLVLPPAAEKKVRNGAALSASALATGEYRTYAQSGEFLALCEARDGRLTTIKSFFEV